MVENEHQSIFYEVTAKVEEVEGMKIANFPIPIEFQATLLPWIFEQRKNI